MGKFKKNSASNSGRKKSSLPLETDNMLSMDQLMKADSGSFLSEKSFSPRKSEEKPISTAVQSQASPMSMDRLLKQYDSDSRLIEGIILSVSPKEIFIYEVKTHIKKTIPASLFSVKPSPGSKIILRFSPDSKTYPYTLVKLFFSDNEYSTSSPKHAPDRKAISKKHFVIDGSNVCRSYLQLQGKSSLRPLVFLLDIIIQYNGSFYCIFDASESYALRSNITEPQGERIYHEFIRRCSRYFLEVPGGTDADSYIMEMARKKRNIYVVSNDRFQQVDGDEEARYWLPGGKKHLIRGEAYNEQLIVKDLGINFTMTKNFGVTAEKIMQYLYCQQ